MEQKQMNEKTNTNCIFLNTPACGLFNARDCESCPMSAVPPENMADADKDMRTMCETLPEDGTEPLFYADECVLCKGSSKGRPAGFAQLNMAHINPNVSGSQGAERNGKTDKKRETRFVVPVQLPVCVACRRRLMLKHNLPLLICVIFAALALLVTSIGSIRTALTAVARVLPFVVFAAIVLLGVGIALIVKNRLAADIKRNTKTDPAQIKQLEKMLKKGWFSLPMGQKEAGITFTGSRLANGILTGCNQKELINAVRRGNRKAEPAEKPEMPENPGTAENS